MFQDYALFPHMNVAANVGYGLMVRHVGRQDIARRVAEALDLVQLGSFANRYPAQLSGGQRQRVALARAIICEPRLILLDEPLAALDVELRKQMQLFLKDIQREIKTTFLFVTHDQEEAIAIADRICVMNFGRILQLGTPREVYYRPQAEFVARFFGDNNLIEGVLAGAEGSFRRIDTALGPHPVRHRWPARSCRGSKRGAGLRRLPAGIRRPGQWRGGWRKRRAGEKNRAAGIIADVSFAGATTVALVNLEGRNGPVPARIKLASRVDGVALSPGGRRHHRLARGGMPAGAGVSLTAARERVAGLPLERLRAGAWPAALATISYGLPVAFILLPLAAFLTYSFFHVSGGTTYYDLTLLNYRRFFTDPIFLPVFWRTCLLCLEVSVLAIAFGYPVAFFLAGLKGRKKYALLMMLLVPLLMSYIIKIYAIRSILGGTGFLNRTLLALGIIDQPSTLFVYNLNAVLLTLTALLIPFAVLPIFLSLERIPRNLLEASADLGASDWQTFGRVILPLSLPGTITAATFVFVLAIGDFLTPQMVGGHQRLHLRAHRLQPVRHRLQLAVRCRSLGHPGGGGDPRHRDRRALRRPGAGTQMIRSRIAMAALALVTGLVFVILYGPIFVPIVSSFFEVKQGSVDLEPCHRLGLCGAGGQ